MKPDLSLELILLITLLLIFFNIITLITLYLIKTGAMSVLALFWALANA